MSGVRHQTLFAALLRRARTLAGLTQEELAARTGLGVRTIRDLERGVARAPHQDTVARLTDALASTPEQHTAFAATLDAAARAARTQVPAPVQRVSPPTLVPL